MTPVSGMSVQLGPREDAERRRTKRARLVCIRCHEKKVRLAATLLVRIHVADAFWQVKCNLQLSTGSRQDRCTPCVDAFAECQ
jgi:hypothetical protein